MEFQYFKTQAWKTSVTFTSLTIVAFSEDDSHLIERVASEFNQLQFYVTQSQGHPMVESIRGVSNGREYQGGE